MSNNNYQNAENTGYPFNNVNSYFPCVPDEPSNSYQETSRVSGGGLIGLGTHLEETPQQSVSAARHSTHKSSGRGRKKQKKKGASVAEPLKAEAVEELDNKPYLEADSLGISDIGIPGISGDTAYQSSLQPDDISTNDNQTLFNSNTLEQILSYKKMLLLQSPEVIEFIQKQRNLANT